MKIMGYLTYRPNHEARYSFINNFYSCCMPHTSLITGFLSSSVQIATIIHIGGVIYTKLGNTLKRKYLKLYKTPMKLAVIRPTVVKERHKYTGYIFIYLF
jgi:hypothetical protein